MSNECKKARNAVLIPLVVLLGLIMFCSSCGSTSPYHAPGITPLNKQYRMNCN